MRKPLGALLVSFSFCAPAYAVMGDLLSPDGFYVNGFMSAGVGVLGGKQVTVPVLSDQKVRTQIMTNTPPEFRSTVIRPKYGFFNGRPDFRQDTIFAIQLGKDFTDKVGMTAQITSKGMNNYDVEAEWAFLSYQASNHWRFRGGRMRIPTYMMSEEVEVGYAYPWVRPPSEVYSVVGSRNYSGVDARYTGEMFCNDVNFGMYWGNMRLRGLHISEVIEVDVPQIRGFDFSYGNEYWTVRTGYASSDLTVTEEDGIITVIKGYADGQLGTAMNPDAVTSFTMRNDSADFFSIGGRFDYHDWIGYTEWVRRKVNKPYFPNLEGWYVTIGKRIDRFTPYATWADVRTWDKSDRELEGAFGRNVNQLLAPLNRDQESLSLGVRYEIMPGAAAKIQWQNIKALHGTRGLFTVRPNRHVGLVSATIDVVF